MLLGGIQAHAPSPHQDLHYARDVRFACVKALATPRQRFLAFEKPPSRSLPTEEASKPSNSRPHASSLHATPHQPVQEGKAMDASSSVELTDPSAIIQVRSKLRWEWFRGLKCCEKRSSSPHLPVPHKLYPPLHAKHRCFRNCRENVSRYVHRSGSQGD